MESVTTAPEGMPNGLAEAGAIKVAEMVSGQLREAADDLDTAAHDLKRSTDYVLVFSECGRDARSLRIMADRIDKKIREGILW